jgi:predicted GIY-YIG superfamily endonuclease
MSDEHPLAHVLAYAKEHLPKDKVNRFKPHYVYMISNASGQLLYVGMSSCMKTRMSEHKRSSPFWDNDCSVFFFETPTRRSALDYEKSAIQSLKPKFNKMHVNYEADQIA